jgi:hypothetical protein
MSASASLRNEIFAGNRAVGRIAFAAAASSGVSRRTRVHEAGALRVRFPNGDGGALDAVIVNTAGGMTGGDRFSIEVKVGPGARLTVTTAAAEKIYRSLGPDTEIGVKLDVGAGGALATPREKDKLLIAMAAMVAARRPPGARRQAQPSGGGRADHRFRRRGRARRNARRRADGGAAHRRRRRARIR